MTALFEWALVIGTAGWLVFGLSRLLSAWSDAGEHTRRLKARKVDDAKVLMKKVEEIDRLTTEISENRTAIDATVQAVAAKRQELEAFVPPPPDDIRVTSEFPAAKNSRPWVATLSSGTTSGRKAADTAGRSYILVWAVDYMTAMSNAARASGRKDLEVTAARLLD